LFLVSIFVALAVSVFGWLLARNLTRPIQQLTTAANASHELRTPLTIIKLRVEALRSGAVNDPPVADRFLEEVESEIDRLSRMVSDLLDLSRMEAGLASRSRTWLDMGSIADDVCETFQIRAERAGINVELNKDPALPSMMGNEDQLHRVLYNLFDNALRYTPKGGTVVVTLITKNSGKTIRLEVRDSGRGIPPEHLPRIFERFYRAEATRPHYGGEDKTSSGSGLGIKNYTHFSTQSYLTSHPRCISRIVSCGTKRSHRL
jgi:two-component system phosphate regulon sensor histidine kinase PhoR